MLAPGQVFNEMSQDDAVREELQQYLVSDATPPIYGNLLTLPVDDGLIYVEPVYVVKTGGSGYPILQYVIVYYDGQVGIGENLTEALASALNEAVPDDTGNGNNGQGGPDGNNGQNQPDLSLGERIDELLRQAQEQFDAAEEVQGTDLEAWARHIEEAERLIAEAVSLADERAAAEGEPTDEPSDGATDEPADEETGE